MKMIIYAAGTIALGTLAVGLANQGALRDKLLNVSVVLWAITAVASIYDSRLLEMLFVWSQL